MPEDEFEIYKGRNISKVNRSFGKTSLALFYVGMVLFVMFIGLIALFTIYNRIEHSNVIQPGVMIKGIDVSGLTKEEAYNKVASELGNRMNDHLVLRYNKKYEYYIDVEQIDGKFDIQSAVDLAYSYSKRGSIMKDINEYINISLTKIDIDPKLVYSEEDLQRYLETIDSYLPDQLIQSSYFIEDDELIITNGINGAGIYYDELKKEIVAALQDVSFKNSYIEIPTYVEYPDPIDVDQIHSEVYTERKNAYYTTEPRAVFADVTGVDFDVDRVKGMINDDPDAEEYAINLDYYKADVTVDDLGMDAFPNLLGTFETEYVNNPDRTTNLRLAAKKINGKVIMPGETFSYNKVVGRRTRAAGYKNAAIYRNGEVVDDVGGGICQVTTTLYNAVVKADLKVTERRNHQFVPTYIGAGKDATVSYGSTDFQFVNSRDYPIKLEAYVTDGICKVSIYGLRTDDEYNITMTSKIIKETSRSIVAEAYKVYRRDGEVVKTEYLHRDTYSKH